MIYIWQNMVILTMLISLVGNIDILKENSLSVDWRNIEKIAEEVPFVVALLNNTKIFICTGIAISKNTVLTTAKCLGPDTRYVVIGQAVINDYINKNKFIEISYFITHPDFTFVWEKKAPHISTIHSNIGIVYTVRQILDLHFEMGRISTFFAPELHDRQFYAIGYGSIHVRNTQVLNRRFYYQEACINPKWYYCVCGFTTNHIDYEHFFGEGGPVLLDTDVIAVITVPCGILLKPDSLVSYNIFTIISPYLTWMTRHRNKENIVKFNVEGGAVVFKPFSMLLNVCLLITSKSFL